MRARGYGQGRGSHGCDGLIVEGDKCHAKWLLVHLLLLPLVVLFQLLLQLGIVLNGLHLPVGESQALSRQQGGTAALASAYDKLGLSLDPTMQPRLA